MCMYHNHQTCHSHTHTHVKSASARVAWANNPGYSSQVAAARVLGGEPWRDGTQSARVLARKRHLFPGMSACVCVFVCLCLCVCLSLCLRLCMTLSLGLAMFSPVIERRCLCFMSPHMRVCVCVCYAFPLASCISAIFVPRCFCPSSLCMRIFVCVCVSVLCDSWNRVMFYFFLFYSRTFFAWGSVHACMCACFLYACT
jgi:hypothetical protein